MALADDARPMTSQPHLSRASLRDLIVGASTSLQAQAHVRGCTSCRSELSTLLGPAAHSLEIAARAIGGLRSGFDTARQPWSATFVLREAVRLSLRRNVPLDGVLVVIDAAMWELQQLTARRLQHLGSTLEALHPTLESIKAVAIASSGCPPILEELERCSLRMMTQGDETTRVGLACTWASLGELGGALMPSSLRLLQPPGKSSAPLDRTPLSSLARFLDPEPFNRMSRSVDIAMLSRNPSFLVWQASDPFAFMGDRAFNEYQHGHSSWHSWHTPAVRPTSLLSALPSTGSRITAQLVSSSPIEGLTGLASFRTLTRSMIVVTADLAERDNIASETCKQLLAPAIADATTPFFATVEAVKELRDWCPAASGQVMAEAYELASAGLRAALCACIAEGYEREYAGNLSEAVPYFDRAGGGFKGVGHALDVFGRRLSSNIQPADAKWWNDRLAASLAPRGPGSSRVTRAAVGWEMSSAEVRARFRH